MIRGIEVGLCRSIIGTYYDVPKELVSSLDGSSLEKREKCIRKKLEVYTEVYIVLIFVYLHVILPYLV